MSASNHIQQLEFDLDLPSGESVRISVNARMDDHDPESTLAREVLEKVLKKQLTDEEYLRIENVVKKLDWHLDLIYRDRKIKEEVQQLVDTGTKLYKAVETVADRFNISVDHVYTRYYGKDTRPSNYLN